MKFKDTGLNPEILKAIEELGFEKPTPIQEKIIPVILEDNPDLIAQAQTGTGKTAAFGLPLIQKSDLWNTYAQTLVLCPTRELCVQISKDIEAYSKYVKGFRVTAVYGGTPINAQITALKKGSNMVVGTPGRVLDLIKRKKLDISQINWLVLDESDEMLNMGFKEELDNILQSSPETKQTLLFSATMPKEIRAIANKYLDNPVEIAVDKQNLGAENIKHEYYAVYAKDRYPALKRIVDINPKVYGIVFCRTRRDTKEVAEKLMLDGYNADALHGDLSQAQRDYVMNRFRTKQLQLLVATDVAARGLDVSELTHIINYHLPDDPEVYVHRSGRTGRAGKSGISISIIHSREVSRIRQIEKFTNKSFEHKKVPGGREICEKQLFNLIDRVERVEVDESQIEQYLPVIYKKLEWLSHDELIKHFVSVEFNRYLAYYKNAPDLNADTSSKGKQDKWSDGRRDQRSGRRDKRSGDRRDSKSGDRRDSKSSDRTSYSRLFINLGSKNDLETKNLIGLVNDLTRNRNIKIGKIEILKKFSFFEVEKEYESKVIQSLNGNDFKGTKMVVQVSAPDPNAKKRGRDMRDVRDKRKNRSSGKKRKY